MIIVQARWVSHGGKYFVSVVEYADGSFGFRSNGASGSGYPTLEVATMNETTDLVTARIQAAYLANLRGEKMYVLSSGASYWTTCAAVKAELWPNLTPIEIAYPA